MSLNQIPDFSFKGDVPFAAIVNAYQQKAQTEEQMRMNQEAIKQQKINNVKDIFNQGAGLVDNLMKYNKQSQIKDAQDAVVNLLGKGATPVPTNQMTPAASSMVPNMTEAPVTQDYSKSPEYKAELASLVTKAFPEEAGKELSKAAFGQLGDQKLTNATKPSPVALEMPDGTQVLGYFDPTDKTYYTQDGTPAPQGSKRSYKYDIRTDSNGNLQIISGASGKDMGTVSSAPEKPSVVDGKTLKTNINQLAPEEGKRLEKLKEDFNTDKAVSAAIAKQSDYQIAEASIEANNWVGDAALISVAAKGLGRDVGALSDVEQDRYQFPKKFVDRVRTKYSNWVKGEIPEQDREVFKDALRVAREKNNDIILKKRKIYANTAKARIKNIDPKFAESYLYEYEDLNTPSAVDKAIEDFFNNPTGE